MTECAVEVYATMLELPQSGPFSLLTFQQLACGGGECQRTILEWPWEGLQALAVTKDALDHIVQAVEDKRGLFCFNYIFIATGKQVDAYINTFAVLEFIVCLDCTGEGFLEPV